jgi:hypothetical protein
VRQFDFVRLLLSAADWQHWYLLRPYIREAKIETEKNHDKYDSIVIEKIRKAAENGGITMEE